MDYEEVTREYNKVLTRVVLRHGTPVDPQASIYGWIAPDWQHKSSCKLTAAGSPEEAEWEEFAGTFAEQDNVRHGIELRVNCQCGQYTNRLLRLSKSPSIIIRLVFEEVITYLKETG